MRLLIIFPLLAVFLLVLSCKDDSPSGINPIDLPTAPTNLVADSVACDAICLRWTDNSLNEDGFRIDQKPNSHGNWSELYTTGPDVKTYIHQNLLECEQYFYRVGAFNDYGSKDTCSELSVTTLIEPPTDLTTMHISCNQIDLSWQDQSGVEDGFIIERKISESGDWEEIVNLGRNELSYSDSNLPESTSFLYRVRVFKSPDFAAYSNTISASTLHSPILSVTPSAQEVGNTAGTVSFEVNNESDGTMDWTASGNVDWFTITPTIGANNETITVNYEANSGEERQSEITITAPDASPESMMVTVTQLAGMPILSVTPLFCEVGNSAGTATFSIFNDGASTMDWNVSENVDWFSVGPTEGTNNGIITLTYDTNSGEEHQGEVVISAPNASPISVTLNVTQLCADPILAVSPFSRSVGNLEGTTTFEVRNAGAGIMNWVASEDADWLSVSPNEGTNNGTITLTYDTNSGEERQEDITLTVPGAIPMSVTVSVTQRSAYPVLVVSPNSRVVGNSAGTTSFSISNTGAGEMDWTSSEEADWFSLTPTEGTNRGTITVDFGTNSGEEREGEIIISAPDASPESVTVSVTQFAADPILVVSPSRCNVENAAGSATFNIRNNGVGRMVWTIIETGDWFSVSPTEGVNNETITIDYDANSGDERRADITITAPDASPGLVTLTLTQEELQAVVSIEPNHALQGETLRVTVTGRGTRFRFDRIYSGIILRKGESSISGRNLRAETNELMEVDFTIPNGAPIGLWDVQYWWDAPTNPAPLVEGFRVNPR
ncbi:MAG: hypothetical protein HN356_04160 [Calditrichaeota bacterium]|nr:hypothetical protein [Calditrichota bacterium]MBT5426163.1 hypothetical protein [Bacteroidota bacterium]MBT7789037.1 hypothetical protein [Calditrichota bacterium]